MRAASLLCGLLWMGLMLTGCADSAPTPAQIESVGLRAAQARQVDAFRQLTQWAESGLPVAQRELALALASMPDRQTEGLEWLERAAQQGDQQALLALGEAYRLGQFGLRPAPERAIPWLRRAAQQGNPDAALSLARQLRNGDGVARDDVQAAYWLGRAATGGNSQAMFLLSQSYAEGRGVPVSLPQARRWLTDAAERHYPAAIQEYALALQVGALGFHSDPQEAAEQLAEATEERHNRWNMR